MHAAPSDQRPGLGQRRRRDDDDHPLKGGAALGPIEPEEGRPVAGKPKWSPAGPTSEGTWEPPLVLRTRGRGKAPGQAGIRREFGTVTTLFSPTDVRIGGEHRVLGPGRPPRPPSTRRTGSAPSPRTGPRSRCPPPASGTGPTRAAPRPTSSSPPRRTTCPYCSSRSTTAMRLRRRSPTSWRSTPGSFGGRCRTPTARNGRCGAPAGRFPRAGRLTRAGPAF